MLEILKSPKPFLRQNIIKNCFWPDKFSHFNWTLVKVTQDNKKFIKYNFENFGKINNCPPYYVLQFMTSLKIPYSSLKMNKWYSYWPQKTTLQSDLTKLPEATNNSKTIVPIGLKTCTAWFDAPDYPHKQLIVEIWDVGWSCNVNDRSTCPGTPPVRKRILMYVGIEMFVIMRLYAYGNNTKRYMNISSI